LTSNGYPLPDTFRGAGGKALCRGLGCPQASFSLSLAACGGERKEKKRFFGDTPHPAKGRPPLGTLLKGYPYI